MIKIIGGNKKNTKLEVPTDCNVRPTTSMKKEADAVAKGFKWVKIFK